jgi:hypothetical protein
MRLSQMRLAGKLNGAVTIRRADCCFAHKIQMPGGERLAGAIFFGVWKTKK